ncbi:dTDP-4-dehydrorhamnose reductase [Acuticoccus sp. M5D2P5]|uniref:dTDP-4-dehydrorhamnose reductase n=1 Tax=Acuticoccus kalidii TaxID=2910977 RepID=UPI001F44252B|nr:dTDP-4-dehydrorhamnose reductase [Acuticoccus kalidii]MCF3933815.1 dTDP-4-dehydrorhamnose reductase [Acuticoccus kalidii]
MTILVIGRSGQVGTALLERAAETGVDLVAVGRPEADITAPAALADAIARTRPSVIVNAAAYTAVDAAETDEAAARAMNADGPGTLAALAAREGIPFIHISTDYVFDGTLDRPYRETDPIAPQSVYGRTKADGEAAVAVAGGKALVLRTSWVYAPFGKNFVRTMLRVGAERDHLRVVADQHGCPTSALDIADAILALAAHPERWPEGTDIVHLAGSGETTWHGFAEAIFADAPFHPTVEAITTADYPTPAARPANSRLDCTKLRTAYGITLPEWRDSTRATVRRLVEEGL